MASLTPKDFLGGIDNVEETILIPLSFIELSKCHGHGSHVPLVHQKEECLVRVELQSPSDNLDQLAYSDMVWDEKLASVKNGKLFLAMESLDDDRYLVWVEVSNLFHILLPLGKIPSLFEGLVLESHFGQERKMDLQ